MEAYQLPPRRAQHRRMSLASRLVGAAGASAPLGRMARRLARARALRPRPPQHRLADLAHRLLVVHGARSFLRRRDALPRAGDLARSEEHTSELQSLAYLVC